MQARGLEKAAGGLSLAGAAAHALAVAPHAAEWWAYGLFFTAAAAAQAVLGLLLLTQGVEGWGGWAAVRGAVYAAGLAGSLALVLLWLASRTAGVPLGPAAGEVEPAGVLDGAAALLGVATAGSLAGLLARRGAA